MPATSRIRFVGGLWHNRIENVELLPRIVIQRALPKVSLSYAGCFAAAKLAQDTYYLAQYHTRWGTRYYQYVHSSLLHGNKADYSTYTEHFARFRLSRRAIEKRLREAMS